MNRAYTVLEIKATAEEGKRTFTGIASTPTTDRMGDIVEPKGAQFKLPIPLLWQHNSDDPVGHITKAVVTESGIEIEGEITTLPAEESQTELGLRLLKAWQMLKSKLVRGLSIGFNPLEHTHIDGTYGYRFLKWEWLELSAVTIPANQEASITAIKSADREQMAALGRKSESFVRIPPGVSGNRARKGVVYLNPKG
jgi:HK97 family phage prohead protease